MKIRSSIVGIAFLFSSFTIVSCKEESIEEIPPIGEYELALAFPNLDFARPVDLQNAGDNSNRLFVVEQSGIISVFTNEETTNSKATFLDIRNKVDDSDNEEGLLGLAFHPNYESNGSFYVNYTASNPSRTVISRFKVSTDPEVADQSSEFIVLEFAQPFGNHNGGQIAFGPDGYLYIATGDGGSGGDPQGNGQSLTTFLGKILRIDVNSPSGGKNYSIPADNPFVSKSGNLEEIFAYGLRNPWRFSFDIETGTIVAADVGQNAYEEIDIVVKGGNYGWKIMEGNHCFSPSTGCSMTGINLPVWEYDRSDGFSVTGGYVYRGTEFREFTGLYIYGDFGSGKIWALDFSDISNPVNTELIANGPNLTSFGVDQANELYICAFDGKIYKLHRF